VSELDLSTALWRKSSHSGAQGGNCVEIAWLSDTVAVRDSKNVTGPVLVIGRPSFSRFARSLRTT
jgi:hypothetical protein